jgi:Flp pilus assembly protein TadG
MRFAGATVMTKSRRQKAAGQRTRRGAILTTELVLVLPIFLLLFCAILEFTFLATARTRITDADHAATRQLFLSDASVDQVSANVAGLLGSNLAHNASINVTPSALAGDLVNVRVLGPKQNATPDLPWMTGFSVRNRTLSVDAPMIREHDTIAMK